MQSGWRMTDCRRVDTSAISRLGIHTDFRFRSVLYCVYLRVDVQHPVYGTFYGLLP